MGRKAGGMYINPKKFGGAGKPCMKEMLQFLGCLSLNNKKDDKCTKFKNLLVACAEEQKGRPKNPGRTINYHLQRLGRGSGFF
ncbi:uncharacterized protein LOC144573582 [Carex rostrata]